MSPRALPRFTRVPVQWLIHTGARFVRPLTLGVRAILLDRQGHVFLVRHTYVPGWQFPGGGVEPGETVGFALRREVREEAGYDILDEPRQHGIFLNRNLSNRDHVIVFVVRSFVAATDRKPDWEIAEHGFFDPAALPAETTAGTRARLRELLDGVPLSETW